MRPFVHPPGKKVKNGRDSSLGIRIVGPGVLLAVLATLTLVRSGRLSFTPPPAPPRPAANRRKPPFPDIATLLHLRKELRLTPIQVNALQALRAEWEARTARQRETLNERGDEMNAYLKDAQAHQRLNVQSLQERETDVSELSAALAADRRVYWERGLSLLTPEQRERLKELR
jgi:hypothetical protein